MAFFASLIAYVASVAGIVLAFTMSYSALVATPSDQPPSPQKAVAAVAAPVLAKAGETVRIGSGQWGPRIEHGTTMQAAATATVATVTVRHKPQRTVTASHEPQPQPLDLQAYSKLWAYQPPARAYEGSLGYAEEPAGRFSRDW